MGQIPARPFGKTGIAVPILALGGAKALEHKHHQAQATRIIDAALEAGVRYIDTAASYNESEEVIGEALHGRRQAVFLGTKSDRRDYNSAWQELERSLKRLRTDYLDLWIVHHVSTAEDIRRLTAPSGGLKAFWQAKEQGIVRYVGISGHHDPIILQQMLERYPFDMVLMPLNPAEWHHPRSFSKQLLPVAVQLGIGIAVMKVPALGKLMQPGRLTPAEAFRYALSHPIHTAVIAPDNLNQWREWLEAAQGFTPLSRDEISTMHDKVSPYWHDSTRTYHSWLSIAVTGDGAEYVPSRMPIGCLDIRLSAIIPTGVCKKMSVLSEIFKGYRNSLTYSREAFERLYRERSDNACQFYHQFFHRLIIPFAQRFRSESYRRHLRDLAERILDADRIDFVAIDGTCMKDAFQDFVVFFGGAYGAKGSVRLKSDPPVVQYERWDMNRDVSLVAYVPVPFANIEDVTNADIEETFVVSDNDRVNLTNIHTALMQLAEIYLAYCVASATTHDYPRLILMDQSLSGLMSAVSHGANTGLSGYPYDRRALDDFDIQVAFAHPINDVLQVPSTKRFQRYLAVLAEFHEHNTQSLHLSQIQSALGISEQELYDTVRYLLEPTAPQGRRRRQPPCVLHPDGTLHTVHHCRESWQYTVSLFENICQRLFQQKDTSALVYQVPDPDDPTSTRTRWMSPDDVHFLTTVGLRALIEKCWERNILLVGVVKDSESRYLTRNYLGVMKHIGVYPELQSLKVAPLPWTDRIFLECIPLYCDLSLEAPWSTIEFDAVFKTLRLGIDEHTGQPEVIGTPSRVGEIVSPERLFLRSLGQFFLSRDKRTPLSGHVIFLDRLAMPKWDRQAFQHQFPIRNHRVGTIRPLLYPDHDSENPVQQLMMYLLDVLTRNHFPEVIGYPDPLHKADWGAKTVGKRAHEMIQSSEIPFHSQPLAKTLRQSREQREHRGE
ncbi:MAG: hypothetical protein C4335_04805 [Armatimonadota bacterium]